MSTTAYLGLGSNLEDRHRHLADAVASLARAKGCEARKLSPMLETKPVGGPVDQPGYLNAAVELKTTLAPEALLDVLQATERLGGRVRKERWGPRTLDLDILLYGSQIIDTDRLQVPHPRMALRMFVLLPLRAIAPELRDPLSGRTISELVANCERRPGVVDLRGWTRFAADAMRAVAENLDPSLWLVQDSLATSLQPATDPTFRVLWRLAVGPDDGVDPHWPPTLVVSSSKVDVAIAETLTACEATRSVSGYDSTSS